MSKYLFLFNLKSNKILIISFTLILTMYSSIATGMYNPTSVEAINSMLDLLPEGFAKAMNFMGFGEDLTTYISHYLYGFIFFIFPMIFIILVGNKVLSKHVDSGSMAYLLTTPHSRIKIATTQAIFLILSTCFVVLFNTILIILMSVALFPGDLDILNFIMLNVTTLSVLLFVSSITYLFSSLFDESSKALSFSSLFAVVFFMANAIKNIDERLEFLKYITPFSLVDIDRILDGGAFSYIASSIMLFVSAVIYYIAIIIFDRRSLAV